jgi:hypothetical protein
VTATAEPSDHLRIGGVALDVVGALAEPLGGAVQVGHRGLLLSAPTPAGTGWSGPVVDAGTGRDVDPAHLTELPNPLLRRIGLSVLRYPATESADSPELLTEVRLSLLAEEQRALVAGVQWCQDFLDSRRAGVQKLSAQPVVAHQAAALFSDAVALLRADLPAALSTAAGRDWLVAEVDATAERLIKLAGGRALLAGQMVSLRTVLLLTNRIYLGSE